MRMKWGAGDPVRGALDRELTKLHGVVVKRQREVT